MRGNARALILRLLEACCWRLATVFGRLDLLLGRWAERVRGAQLWAIDRALVVFQATFPNDPSVPAPSPPPSDFSPLALPDAVPVAGAHDSALASLERDVATVSPSLAPSIALENHDPRVLH